MKTLGKHLEDPNMFFWWLNNAMASFYTLNFAVKSGLVDAITDEPVTVEALAAACSIPSDKLKRLVNFLAAEEILTLLPDGRVAHTQHSRSLPSLESAFTCLNIGLDAAMQLDEALRKGVTPYEYRYGKPVFEHFAENPKTAAVFANFMSYMTGLVQEFVFTQHEFLPFKVAVDVGGNHGGLLLTLLARHPDSRGIVFDLPEVTEMMTDQVLSATHGDRVELIGGNFFESVPSADLYLLKMILHDWNDADCIQILRCIRDAIVAGGRIAVIDFLLPESPQQHPSNAMDLAMLVWATGRERKLSEFTALFDASGFRLDRVANNAIGQSLIEAVAA